ncbi:MAG: hypothetical protein ACYS14_10500 [Planctomycetota bacterium]|jgi:hypothetical protein
MSSGRGAQGWSKPEGKVFKDIVQGQVEYTLRQLRAVGSAIAGAERLNCSAPFVLNRDRLLSDEVPSEFCGTRVDCLGI